MTKVLIDTNVFLYALDKDSNYHSRVMTILGNEKFQLYTTSKNISEYFAVTSKLRVPPKQVWSFYKDIKNNTIIIYPDDKSLGKLERLIKKHQPKGNKIYDLDIVSIALTSGIKRIATVNQKDFQGIKGIVLI